MALALVLAGCGAQRAPDEVQTVASALNTVQVDSFFNDGNGWTDASAYSTIRYPDVNNDVRSDVCGRRNDGVWCAVDDGTGKLVNPARWNSTFTDANGWNADPYFKTIAFPDLNNDGKADICGRGPTAPGGTAAGIWCGLSNGHTFGSLSNWNSGFSDGNGWNQPQYYSTIQFPDVNRDGKADVCARGVAGILCGVNTGTSFGSAAVPLWSSLYSDVNGWTASKYYTTIHFPDINGDGVADVCGRGPDGNGNVGVWCGTSNGSTFNNVTMWNTTFGDPAWDDYKYFSTIQFADVNGDGKDDLCGRGPGGGAGTTIGVWCALSNGTNGFGTPTLWNTTIGNYTWDSDVYSGTIRASKGMVCGRGVNGMYCAYSNGTTFKYEVLESSNESDASGWGAPWYYKTLGVTSDFKIAGRGSAGIWATPTSRDELSINTSADVTARRSALINRIWGQTSLDTTQGVDSDTVLNTNSIDGLPLPAGTTVHRYQINMPTSGGIPVPGGPASVQGLADFYMPPGGSTRFVILSPGHACTYARLPAQGAQTIVDLLNERYAVLATYLPGFTPLDCCHINHNQLFVGNMRPANGRHPYVYFLDPIRRSLNTIASQAHQQIDMAGVDGGGWATTVYAALDTRVTASIPVSGTEPFYMRSPQDTEQNNDVAGGNDFFSFATRTTPNKLVVTGYKDLYLLGGAGTARKQIQVLNRNDDCCFGAAQFTSEPSGQTWDQAARANELEIRQRLATLPAVGSFRLEINEADDNCTIAGTCGVTRPFDCGGGSFTAPARHEISKNARTAVILSELNGNDAVMSSPGGGVAFARSFNGDFWFNDIWGWTDTGIPMVGTPAGLWKASSSLMDGFYRDPNNHPVHATWSGDGNPWQPTGEIGGTIISDPAVASAGAGFMDMMAVGADYHLSHWWSTGGPWSVEAIDTGTARAVGRPALTSWGPGRLDVFFRGHESALYHAWTSTGSGPYQLEVLSGQLPGGVIKSYPSAGSVVGSPGSLFVYVTGTNNGLYEIAKVDNGAWTTTQVIGTSNPGYSNLGSPSASVSSAGDRSVAARVNWDNFGFFSRPHFQSFWSFTYVPNPGDSILGSPSPGGSLIIDTTHVGLQPSPGGSNNWGALTGAILDR
jgi:hypothetical protein